MDGSALIGFGLEGWWRELAAGMVLTAALAVATLPIGLALGIAVALAKDSQIRWIRVVGEGYTTVFRGLPELLTLLLIYYGGQIAVQECLAAMGLSSSFQISPFAAGVVALALVFGAYTSEVLLGALRALDRGQVEAGVSFGMPPRRLFLRVKLPQISRLALPGLGNSWMVLLKDTSLVSVVGLADLLRETTLAAANTRQPFLFYGVACALYLVLTAMSDVGLWRIRAWAGKGWNAA